MKSKRALASPLEGRGQVLSKLLASVTESASSRCYGVSQNIRLPARSLSFLLCEMGTMMILI